ncbi:MAG: dodecin [Acidimicrobiales bacterium]
MQEAARTDEAHDLFCPTYRLTEIVGTASGSVDDAIANGIAKAAQTLHGLDWFQVTEIRGSIRDGAVGHTQVTMKGGFRVD